MYSVIEAALCTIFTLQTSFKPLLHGGGGRGGGGTMSSCTVLHSCHPVTYKTFVTVYKFDLFIVVIYSIYLLNHGYTYFVIPSLGVFLFTMPVPHWSAVLISRNHSITRLISFQK
jgi:hypothetical protein